MSELGSSIHPVQQSQGAGAALKHALGNRDVALAVMTLILFAVVTASFPQFAQPGNIAEILDDSSILILLALGQMLVILTRAIDLSVAANLALSGMIAALCNKAWPDANVAVFMTIALTCGCVLGACNGLLVWKVRLPPIVVTLGTMSIYRGIIYLISHGTWVNDNEMSHDFLSLVRMHGLGLSMLSWLAVGGTLIAIVALRYSRLGRNLYAAGGNPSAAAYIGIDAGRMQFLAYTLCGGIAGLCGYLWVARFAVAYTDIALGFELQVIAACLIGGVAIAGGIGSAIGVVLGCLFLGVIRNALPLLGISPFWQMGINGVVIITAAVLGASQRTMRRSILEREAT